MSAKRYFKSEKVEAFVTEYINNGFKAEAAARFAGYKGVAASVRASELLADPGVKDLIQKRLRAIFSNTDELTMQWVREVKRLAFSDLRDAVEYGPDGVVIKKDDELSQDTAAAIEEVSETQTLHGGSKKIKLHSKTKALELLGKYLAILTENPPQPSLEETKSIEQTRERIAFLLAKREGKK